eukprot:TRINITY_DN4518_c0_g1_i3.p1 TRINITY_DN4518_c0_g1~~TRINITY_DN4518_c0_g1_i3.p1  ORF type:complete len:162 (+),score=12.71 TRINITY_DN4518_c0_g1_i3:188-673(+)
MTKKKPIHQMEPDAEVVNPLLMLPVELGGLVVEPLVCEGELKALCALRLVGCYWHSVVRWAHLYRTVAFQQVRLSKSSSPLDQSPPPLHALWAQSLPDETLFTFTAVYEQATTTTVSSSVRDPCQYALHYAQRNSKLPIRFCCHQSNRYFSAGRHLDNSQS